MIARDFQEGRSLPYERVESHGFSRIMHSRLAFRAKTCVCLSWNPKRSVRLIHRFDPVTQFVSTSEIYQAACLRRNSALKIDLSHPATNFNETLVCETHRSGGPNRSGRPSFLSPFPTTANVFCCCSTT